MTWRLRLDEPANTLGLEWPAGIHLIEDPFWADVLLKAGAKNVPGRRPSRNGGELTNAPDGEPEPDGAGDRA